MRMNKFFGVICLALTVPALVSCGAKKVGDTNPDTTEKTAKASMSKTPPVRPAQLPVRFQSPSYIAALDTSSSGLFGEEGEEYQIRVGATIRSTGGPQPLWQVMKRLANLKGMTVSWASDVDQTIMVDVDIAADDKFFDAVANLLRQADYFHEVNGKSIVIRNKATKVYQIGMPAMKGGYSTNIGGNFLANKDAASGAEGTVKITSPENNFDVWQNIEANLKVILQTAAAERQEIQLAMNAANAANAAATAPNGQQAAPTTTAKITNTAPTNTAKDGGYFVIDKNVGLVTVTAKPSLLRTVDNYIENLRKSMYQQVNIEAKIIEVYLQDNSRIGLNWDDLLGGQTGLSSTFTFGDAGQVYPHANTPGIYASTFVSRISMSDLGFDVFLNALKQQGDTHVLANPKITVLNGQPALISVGKDVAYIKSVTREKDGDTGDVTYTAETGNVVQGIALGVMASVLDDQRVILHLTPITTDLENLNSDGDIPMTLIGEGETAMSLGLPKVKVREMSTMVEVHNGEMLIIGGLIDSTEGETSSFAPGVGDIPVLKYLFGYEEKTMQKRELVILLTPRIM